VTELTEAQKAPIQPQEINFRDYYIVNPPFGYAGIAIDPVTGKLTYLTLEPELSASEQEALNSIRQAFINRTDIPIEALKDEARMEKYLRDELEKIFKKLNKKVELGAQEKFVYYLKRDFLGYGKIDIMMRDPNIEDISCNGLDTPLYIWHRVHESIPSNLKFDSRSELSTIVTRLAYKTGRQISVARPIMEGTLPEGYRVHLTLEEISKRGSTFTIRKFRSSPYTILDLIRFKTIDAKIAAYLWVLVDNQRSMMISGATASGKTTILNSICMFIKPEDKVVTIEEVRELRLHENWIPMVPRASYQLGVDEITLFDLLKSALRQRPDFIVVGEVRGEEAYTLFQSIATGHGGLCTIHADSVESVIKRLMNRPMEIPPMMIPLMNTVLQIRRVRYNGAIVRRATNVTEIVDVSDSGAMNLQNRFLWDPETDSFQYKEPYGEGTDAISMISSTRMIPLEKLMEEMEKREVVINWMLKKGLKDYDEVAEIVRRYYNDAESIYSTAQVEMQE
jgi:flagellar protein FlaI